MLTRSSLRIMVGRIFLSIVLVWQAIYFLILPHQASLNELPADSIRPGSGRKWTDYCPRIPDIRSKWPPSRLSDIRNPIFGLYDLTLRPLVISNIRVSNDHYFDTLKSMYDGKRVSGSQTKQLVMMDQAMRIGGSNPNFYLYPQTMDLIAAVKSIRSGLHVDEYPINNPELYVIESPQFTCNHTDQRRGDSRRTHPLDLVILVKSCLDCADKRTHIRSTYMQSHLWSGYHVQFAFVVGLPFIQVSKHLRFDGVNFTREHKIVNYTQLKRARVNLFRESAQYNDLLIGGFHDMYFNLTLKLIFTFRWASAFCKDQTPIFLFVDDDISVNPRNLMKFLGRIPISGRTHFNGGMPPASQIPIRPNSTLGGVWAVSEDEFPWERYPSYSLGAGYLVGADYVYDAAVAMAFTQFFRIDDAFLGMVWAKLNYPVLNVPGFRLWIPSSEEVSQTIIAFSNSMDQYINWETGEMKQASSKQPPQTKI